MKTLALTLLATVLLGACASSPPATRTQAEAPVDRNCLRETGSRIPPRPGACVIGVGRSYSRDDLDRTGGATTGDALRRLVPR